MPVRTLFKRAMPFIIIVFVGFLVYSNTFNVPFQFDDGDYIRNNPAVKDFSYARKIINYEWFTGLDNLNRNTLQARYLAFLSFRANYMLGGFDVRGYHFVNLAIHVLNATIIFFIVSLTLQTPRLKVSGIRNHVGGISLFSALLFVSHPIQTQAVTYISQRFASLAAMFYFLSLLLYVKSRLAEHNFRKNAFYALSLLSAVAAMKTKEISFTLPLAVVLYDMLFFEGPPRARLKRFVPFFIALVIVPLSHMELDKPLGEAVDFATRMEYEISRSGYLITQLRVVVTYLRLLMFPVNQNLDYDYPKYHLLMEPQVFFSIAFLVTAIGFVVYVYHRWKDDEPALRIVMFGGIWFFLTLSVESSIIPLADVIFEHRLYLASMGFFFPFVTLAFLYIGKTGTKKNVVFLLLTLLVLVMGAGTLARNRVWQSELSLWQDVVKKSPRSARGYNNVGVEYQEMGADEKAIEYYEKAIQLNPDDGTTWYNLGLVYEKQGHLDKAIEYYLNSVRRNQYVERVHYSLGALYSRKGLYDRSMQHFTMSVNLNPGAKKSYVGLGDIYWKQGLYDEAVKQYRAAIDLDPNYVEALGSLGNLYRQRGMLNEALAYLGRAAALDPSDVAIQYNLGLVFWSAGRSDTAVEHFLNVVRLNPDDVEAHYNLGVIYWEKARVDNAIAHYRRVIEIRPDLAEAHHNLALAYKTKGSIEEAMEQLRIAIRLRPDDALAHVNLGALYLEKGQTTPAREELETALRLDPNNEEARKVLDKIRRK